MILGHKDMLNHMTLLSMEVDFWAIRVLEFLSGVEEELRKKMEKKPSPCRNVKHSVLDIG